MSVQDETKSRFADDFRALLAKAEEVTGLRPSEMRRLGAETTLLEELDDQDSGEISVAQSEVSSWPAGEFFLELFRIGREDLAIEQMAVSGLYPEVFSEWHTKRAHDRITLFQRIRELEKNPNVGDTDELAALTTDAGIFVVEGRPYAVSCPSEPDFRTSVDMSKSIDCAECDELNEYLERTRSLDCDDWANAKHQHLIFCERCRNSNPTLVAVFEAIRQFRFRRSRRLLRVLHQCLETAMQGSNAILRSSSPGEGEPLHSTQSDALLAMRTLVLADFLLYRVSVEAFVDSVTRANERNPWIALRKGSGDPSGVAFVTGLDSQEFLAALFLQEFDQNLFTVDGLVKRPPWVKDANRSILLPGLRDLDPVESDVYVVETANEDTWLECLGNCQAIAPSGLLRLTLKAAQYEYGKITRAEPVEASHSSAIQTLNEKVDSVISYQTALGEMFHEFELRMEEERLRRQPYEEAERSARDLVSNEVFDALCPKAQRALVAAEFVFNAPRHPDLGSALTQLRKAFDLQMGHSILQPFDRWRRSKSASLPAFRIGGPSREFLNAVMRGSTDEIEFLRSCGIDSLGLQIAGNAVKGPGNLGTHDVPPDDVAWKLRGTWFKNGRAFRALFTGNQLASRSAE
jgi:hypothetical protein